MIGSGDAARGLVWQSRTCVTGYIGSWGWWMTIPSRRGDRVLGVPVLGCCGQVPELAAPPAGTADRGRDSLAALGTAAGNPRRVPGRMDTRGFLPRPPRTDEQPVGVSALREVWPEDLRRPGAR